MKYFLDTEFIEGTQKKWFGQTKPTIDLISIGIVCENGREYYAISKDFNLKEAWNRFQRKEQTIFEKQNAFKGKKEYWIRDNVLKSIYTELEKKEIDNYKGFTDPIYDLELSFNYSCLKRLIKKYGKSNKQIAEDIKDFVFKGQGQKIRFDNSIQFYGYYSDYDWVVFCWLFGKMIDLPKGFPMYCIDLKQILDERAKRWLGNIPQQSCVFCDDFDSKLNSIKSCKDYPKQTNEHNALADARWTFELHKFLNDL